MLLNKETELKFCRFAQELNFGVNVYKKNKNKTNKKH